MTESVRVRVHPGLCEGWGNCHRWAPAIYPLDDEGKIDLHLLEVPPELAVSAWLGAEACPARAITVITTPALTTPVGIVATEQEGALHEH